LIEVLLEVGAQLVALVRGYVLYVLLSGYFFYVGLALMAGGAVLAVPHPRAAARIVWTGLVLALVSAVPIHSIGYLLLALSVVVWQISLKRGTGDRLRVSIILFAVVSAVIAAGIAVRADSGLKLSRDMKVFVIGDSLSAGLGDDRSQAWAELLATARQVDVSNLARPGATLSDGASQGRVIPQGPVIVLLELGGNDLLAGTTPKKFGAELRSLLAALAVEKRRVVMFELPLLPFQNAFGRTQREVCQQYGIALLLRSLLAGAVALPGHTSDGLHLTAQGHAWLAERVGRIWTDR
jgi:lysophospholipase L1-like esterase